MGELLLGPISRNTLHLCIDMQRLFAPGGPWSIPWVNRILPTVTAIAEHSPERTIFTRFMPPFRAEDMRGTWRAYYERWREVTRERIDAALLELVPPLARLAPPAAVIDKTGYSAFSSDAFDALLRDRQADALIVTGGETDICVLASVLGAVDRGYRVILVRDAVCSGSDACHDALLRLYHERFSQQIEAVDAEFVLERWPA